MFDRRCHGSNCSGKKGCRLKRSSNAFLSICTFFAIVSTVIRDFLVVLQLNNVSYVTGTCKFL